MRIALLSASIGSADSDGADGAPAWRRFAGKPVLHHQIDCAAHLGCDRVVCLATGSAADMVAAQAYARTAGLRFDTVPTLPHLVAQVSAGDDVVLLEDGLMPDRAALVAALGQGPAVLAFTDEPAIVLGFERLDATRAWAGALRVRGDCVARLADMPADCELGSTLLRLALQSGVRVIAMDELPLQDHTWQRRIDPSTASTLEWKWITRQTGLASFAAPGRALVDRVALRLARDLAGRNAARITHGGAALAAVLSLAAVVFGWPVAGLASLLGAVVLWQLARVFARVESLGAVPQAEGRSPLWVDGALDVILLGLLAKLMNTAPAWLNVALPLILLGLLWLGAKSQLPRIAALSADRVLLIAVLLLAAVAGLATVAVMGLSLLALGALIAANYHEHRAIRAN